MTQGAYRRVVTGLDERGRSTIAIDGSAIAHGDALGMIWRTGQVPADNASPEDGASAGFDMSRMQAGGTSFFVYEHQPRSNGFWHTTDTIDYIVMLEGEVVFEVDTGEVVLKAGDFLVDRGARHRWRNDTDRIAKAACIAIPAVPLAHAPAPE